MEKKKCVVCGGSVRFDRHKFSGAYCSLKCEKRAEEIENFRIIENTRQGDNLRALTEWAKFEGKWDMLLIGDTHFPWVDEPTLELAYEYAEQKKPKVIVQMGDLYDFYSQTRFPKVITITPRDEARIGRAKAEEMWARLHKASPKSKLIQIRGNHDDRPMKRMLESAPELEPFLDMRTIWEFPQVETVFDSRQEVIVQGVCLMHGFRKFGEHAKFNLMPTACGHSHQASVSYFNHRGRVIWELNVGFAGDPYAKALGYQQQRFSKWTRGIGIVDEYGPRFIPVEEKSEYENFPRLVSSTR